MKCRRRETMDLLYYTTVCSVYTKIFWNFETNKRQWYHFYNYLMTFAWVLLVFHFIYISQSWIIKTTHLYRYLSLLYADIHPDLAKLSRFSVKTTRVYAIDYKWYSLYYTRPIIECGGRRRQKNGIFTLGMVKAREGWKIEMVWRARKKKRNTYNQANK